MPFLVARIAARAPGFTTPTTGMSAFTAMSPIADTSIELHAITRSFTSCCTRYSAISSA
jgi:hypothetical protein